MTMELVPLGEQVSTEEEVSTPVEAQPEALTEEKVQKMIAEATAKAVTQAKELGKRELQSAQDRNKAELSRAQQRAARTERSLEAARYQLRNTDPDLADRMELAELRANQQGYQSAEQSTEAERVRQEFGQQFHTNLSQFITSLEVDPTDKRIDWDSPFQDYLELQGRVLNAVGKIQKENIQTTQSGLAQRLKDLEAKIGETETEANSVNTAGTGVVPTGSDAEFLQKFGAGDIPANKENIARHKRIINS